MNVQHASVSELVKETFSEWDADVDKVIAEITESAARSPPRGPYYYADYSEVTRYILHNRKSGKKHRFVTDRERVKAEVARWYLLQLSGLIENECYRAIGVF